MLNTFIRGTATGSGGGVAQHASFQIPFSCCCYCCSHFIFCKRTAAFASLKVAGERGVARCQVRTDGLSTLLISVYTKRVEGRGGVGCRIFSVFNFLWVSGLLGSLPLPVVLCLVFITRSCQYLPVTCLFALLQNIGAAHLFRSR